MFKSSYNCSVQRHCDFVANILCCEELCIVFCTKSHQITVSAFVYRTKTCRLLQKID
jgi:hypothetical protein